MLCCGHEVSVADHLYHSTQASECKIFWLDSKNSIGLLKGKCITFFLVCLHLHAVFGKSTSKFKLRAIADG